MNNRIYIIWLDILGFKKLAEKIANLHKISAGKVREDFVNGVKNKVEYFEKRGIIEKSGYRKEYDTWVLFIRNLDNVFEFIKGITGIKIPYEVKRIPVEIAIGLFKSNLEYMESYEVYEKEAIQFLNTYIINEYREWYRQKYEVSPKETYILITKEVFENLELKYKKLCEHIIGRTKRFYKFNMSEIKEDVMKETQLLDIDELLDRCYWRDIDFLMRDRAVLENEEEEYIYTQIKRDIFQRIQNEKDFIIQISQQNFLKQLRKAQIKIVCEVEFDYDINTCTFNHNGNKLVLNNPLLLWECSCRVPEEYRNKNYQCRIHSNPDGKIIESAFGKKFTKIRYDVTKVLWFDTKMDILWPPAIESIFMAKTLKEKEYKKKIIENVLDMGCGTGFLGIYLAKINPYVKKVYFSDLFSLPLLMTKLNWGLNFGEDSTKVATVFLSENYENFPARTIPSSGFDLIICNPPFLPTLGYEWLLYKKAAVAGTHLLEKVITKTKKYGTELIIGCSDMAHPEFKEAVRKVGANKKILGKREIPFRIPYAFNHKEFMDKLISKGRIKQKDKSPFKFWSTFYVYKVTY